MALHLFFPLVLNLVDNELRISSLQKTPDVSKSPERKDPAQTPTFPASSRKFSDSTTFPSLSKTANVPAV